MKIDAMTSYLSQYKSVLTQKNLSQVAIVSLVLSGLLSSLVSITLFISIQRSSEEVVVDVSKPEAEQITLDVPQEIVVDLSGAVESPGTLTLLKGARLSQAIDQAGGFTKDADKAYLSKTVNLAQKLQDGQKIFIPARGDSVVSMPEQNVPLSSAVGGTGFLLDINTASLEELDTLSGIGETRAQAIIANRPYISAQELVEKKVISQSVYDGIKDQISAQ